MARPPKYNEDQILDAALSLAAEGGEDAATMTGVAAMLGAPVGSIYHRFKSRDLLLAHLWIRTIKRFQVGFIEALAGEDLDQAAVDAVRHIIQWERDHFDEARIMIRFRREELAARWPDELGEELATLNTGVEQAIRDYAIRRYGDADPATMQRVIFALIDVPYAANRRYLVAGMRPPPSVDDLVLTTLQCVLRD